MIPKKLENGKWQVRWRDESGKQRAKNCRTKELAYDFIRAHARGETEKEEKKVPAISFKDFALKWHQGYCKVEKAETQWVDDWSIIKNHLLPAFGDVPLASLKKQHLLELRGHLRSEKGHSVKTVNNVAGLARKMLQTAFDWELVSGNPFASVRPLKQTEQLVQFWTVEERERFLSYCRRADEEFAVVVEFACHTGLRLGEISGLKRDSLDFDRRVIVVRRNFNWKLRKLFETTKGRKAREVGMNPAVWRLLQDKRLLAPSAQVFPYDLSHASQLLGPIAKKAGVKVIRFHDLRHTFASHLAMGGLSLIKIQALLGHADFKQTLRYAHLCQEAMAGATDILCASNVHSVGERKSTV